MTHLSQLEADKDSKLHIGSGGTGEQQKPPYNVAFGILSALAMLMIVAGHQGYDILTVGGLFPYYSFLSEKEGEETSSALLDLECGVRASGGGVAGFRRICHGRGGLPENLVCDAVFERLSVYPELRGMVCACAFYR